MKPTQQPTPPAAKPARLSKTKQLEADLAARTAALEAAERKLRASEQALRDREAVERRQGDRIRELEERSGKMLSVLKPFFEHTRDWEGQWPADKIAVTRRLTFGHLKAARDTYVALSK